MRIVGFLQIKDEVSSGHLERYLRLNGPLLDAVYAIDDASEDETASILEAHGAVVLRNIHSRFQSESDNKAALLDLVAARERPGTAILWLDADEVLYCARSELEKLVEDAFASGFDSISFSHLNLWRSEAYHRVDDNYFSLRPVRIWRLSEHLSFSSRSGLHGQTHPHGLKSTFHSKDFPVFHFGFASTELILNKYQTYFRLWQDGYALNRLVDETTLSLEHVEDFSARLGERYEPSRVREDAPSRIAPFEWQLRARKARAAALNNSKPKVTIVCLVFKSVEWLEFAYGEALRLRRDLRRGEVEILFIANDPTQDVQDFLNANSIPHLTFSGRASESEWYINSVYRAYNFGVKNSKSPLVYLINSDMAFSPGSLKRAIDAHQPGVFLATRLVENGRLPTGHLGVERDFGSHPSNFRRKDFLDFSEGLRRGGAEDGGLYMPLLVAKEDFDLVGGFPEGNLTLTSEQKYLSLGSYEVAVQGESCIPGDRAFMARASTLGLSHKTCMDSIAYHFQEGELKSKRSKRIPSGFLIVNDRITGVNGEVTLWNRIDRVFVQNGKGRFVSLNPPQRITRLNSFLEPFRLLWEVVVSTWRSKPRVQLSNGTFQLPFASALRNLILVQDRPSSLRFKIWQEAWIRRADLVLTNDLKLSSSKLRRGVVWIEIAANIATQNRTIETKPMTQDSPHKPRGIFVGAFNQTKGLSLLKDLVLENPQVSWTLVSKIPGDPFELVGETSHMRILTAISQDSLFEEMSRADFLVSTSPHETQHLASIEAAWLDVPVFITPTGLLGTGVTGATPYGFVSSPERFLMDFTRFLDAYPSISPLRWLGDVWTDSEADLFWVLREAMERSFEDKKRASQASTFLARLKSYLQMRAREILRQKVTPLAIRLSRAIRAKE